MNALLSLPDYFPEAPFSHGKGRGDFCVNETSIEQYVLRLPLAQVTVDYIVSLARATDFPEVISFGKMFYRGEDEEDSSDGFHPKQNLFQQVETLASRFPTEDPKAIQQTFEDIYIDRFHCRLCDPSNSERDIICFISLTENTLVWYNVTRNGGRRDEILTDPKHPQFRFSCLACGNRFDRRIPYCGTCRLASYCSSQCQRRDWKLHQKECEQFRVLKIWKENQIYDDVDDVD